MQPISTFEHLTWAAKQLALFIGPCLLCLLGGVAFARLVF